MFTTICMYVTYSELSSMLAAHQQHVFTTCSSLHNTINHRLKTQVHLEVEAGVKQHMFTSHQQNAGQNHIT
jgi:hypothetical protein